MRTNSAALLTGILLIISPLALSLSIAAQADDFCREFGLRPSSDEPGARIAYVYGRVAVKGLEPNAKAPPITVNFLDPLQMQRRLTIDRAGSFCFRRSNAGGTLVIEVDGVETARKTISSIGAAQTREDFEIVLSQKSTLAPPGVVSSKYSRPRNDKTVDLYQNAAAAEDEKNPAKTIGILKEIVEIDPDDFIAWAKLGSLLVGSNSLKDAESAFVKSLELRADYPPALMNFGMLRAFQSEFDAAIGLFRKAIATDPTAPRAYRLLGEAYLQIRKGTLALEALNEALRLDPVGQAECHLLIARLYDLAGAKNLASAQYKAFIAKVPRHPDRKKFERYIADNPSK